MQRSLTCEAIARAALGKPTKRARAESLWHYPNHENSHEASIHSPTITRARCAIVPDANDPGREHAQRVAAAMLCGKANQSKRA
jgi:hypothetical protein